MAMTSLIFLHASLIYDAKRKTVNSLPNDETSDWSKMKAFADDKINVSKNLRSVLERIQNIVGKGENVGNQHFLLFLQYFPKASYSRSLKVGIDRERVKQT